MRIIVTMAAALLLAGCAGGPMPANPESSTPSTPPPGPIASGSLTPASHPSGTPTPGPTAPASPDPTSRFETTGPLPDATGSAVPLPRELRDAIAADLENRGVDVARLTVISAHRATWQDGAWGCPAPGKVYTQAIEDGYAVIVEAAGVRYDYRFGSGPVPKLCLPPGRR